MIMNANHSGSVEPGPTSDGGGIHVKEGVQVTGNMSLGAWAGTIQVDAGAYLNAWADQLKNMNADASIASVWVDGELNLRGLSGWDGKSKDQNWHIGQNGYINLDGVSSIGGSVSWNIELISSREEQEIAGLTNRTRTEGVRYTRTFISAAGDISGKVTSLTVYDSAGTLLDYTVSHSSNGLSISYDALAYASVDLTWAGAEDDVWVEKGACWVDASGTATSFLNDDNVTFAAEAEGVSTVVTIGGDVTTGTVAINDNYTFTASGAAALTSAGGITVAEGKTLTKGGSESLTIYGDISGQVNIAEGALHVNDSTGVSFTIGANADLYMDGVQASVDGALVTGQGSLHLNMSTDAGASGDSRIILAEGSDISKVYVSGVAAYNKNQTALASNFRGADLHLTNSSVLLVRNGLSGSLDAANIGDIHFDGNGELRVYGGISNAVINDNVYASNGQLNKTDTGTITLAGVVTASNIVNKENGTLKLTNANNRVDRVYAERGTTDIANGTYTKAYASAGTLNIADATVKNVRLEGSGTVTITGNSVIGVAGETYENRSSGLYAHTGTLNIGDGSTKTLVTATRLETGDGTPGNNDHSGGVTNVKKNATLVITAAQDHLGDTGQFKTHGFMVGAWGYDTVLNVEGTILAQNVQMATGDKTGVVNLESGSMLATKGIRSNVADANSIELNLKQNATLVLGSEGINNLKSLKGYFGAGVVGISANATISENLTLGDSTTGTTFNTQMYEWGTDSVTGEVTCTQGTNGGELTISGVIGDYSVTAGEGDAAQTTVTPGKLVKAGAGTLVLTAENTYTGGTVITGGVLKADHVSALSSGGVTLDGGTLETIAGASINDLNYISGELVHDGLTVNGITLSGYTLLDNSANTGGALTLNGTLTLENPEYLPPSGSGTYSGGTSSENGFYTGDYLVISGGTIQLGTDFKVEGKGVTGSYAIVDDGLAVSVADNSTFVVNTKETLSAGVIGTEGFSHYHINADGILDTGNPDTLPVSVRDLLESKLIGSGTLLISKGGLNTSESGTEGGGSGSDFNITTKFGGKVELAAGITFSLGRHTAGNQIDTAEIDTSSLTGFVLNNGSTLQYNGNGNTSIANLHVKDDTSTTTRDSASIYFVDGNKANAVQLTGTTQLDGNLNLTSQYDGAIRFHHLTGAGSLIASKDGETFNLSIDSLADFTGSLSFTSKGGDPYNVTVNTGSAGADFSAITLKQESTGALNFIFNVQGDTTIGTIDPGNTGGNRYNIASGVTLTVSNNMWMKNSAINLAEGATFQHGGGWRVVGTGAESSISRGNDGQSQLILNQVSYTISNADVIVNKNDSATLAMKLVNSSLTNEGAGTLSVNNAGNTISLVDVKAGNVALATAMEVNAAKVAKDATLSLAGGVNHTIGSIDTAAGGGVSLGAGASLTLSDTLPNGYMGSNTGNNNDKASLELNISGTADSKNILNLTLDTNTGWAYNNTVKLTALTGNKTVDEVHVSGALAADVFSGNAKTHLGGAKLVMADGSDLVLRKNGADVSTDFGASGIELQGTTTLHLYGDDASSTRTLTSDISGGTLKSAMNGAGKLTGALNLAALEVGSTKLVLGGTSEKKLGSVSVLSGKTLEVESGRSLQLVDSAKNTGVTFSASAGKDATLKGVNATGTLAQLQNAAAFSISDMALSNVSVSAATADTAVNLTNVTSSAVLLAQGRFTMTNQAVVDFLGVEGSKACFTTDLLSGITLNNTDSSATLTVDLGDLAAEAALEDGKTYDLSITLNGFTMMNYEVGTGLVFAADSWLGQLLAEHGATEYVSGSLEALEAVASTSSVKVTYTDGGANVGTIVTITGLGEVVPEPASATLSLAALMMLCARRRRRK